MDTFCKSVEDYIKARPKDLQPTLIKIRQTILDNALGVSEGISYGMPVYKHNKKPLVYFGAYAKHIGFYATPGTHEAFQDKLAAYKQGKGSVQFPLNQPVPYDLIAEMVRFRKAMLDTISN